MSEKSFQKALREARNKAYEEGKEAARKQLELETQIAREGWEKFHLAQDLLETRAKDKIVELIKESLTELVNDAACDLANELEYEAEEQIDEAKQKAVPSSEA
jgi:hypothetical protein